MPCRARPPRPARAAVVVLGAGLLAASPAAPSARMIAAARELLGVPYQFGGRMRGPGEGIDCQGVLFYAAERVGSCGWKSFSVKPTRSLAWRELGAPVPGLDPVAATKLDPAQLRPGDVILLVGFDENPAEPAIAQLEGRPVWVWHTGLYSGDGRWIVGDHYAGEVVEVDLQRYLTEHRDVYSGLLVTRIAAGPKPRRCRHHLAMRRPEPASAPASRPAAVGGRTPAH